MLFREVIGQEHIKELLRVEANQGRVPHAMLFHGPEGCGKLPMALALARYLLCTQLHDGEPCGVCRACKMTAKWVHPDLHFVFPIIKPKNTDKPVSDYFLGEWRQQLINNPYFSLSDWLDDMKAANQQALIYAAESDAIHRKMSFKADQGGKKVMIIWLPEKMNVECGNKLLKLIEEPPVDTHLILVSEQPDLILPTIISRTRKVSFKKLTDDEVVHALVHLDGCDEAQARSVAHTANGNLIVARQMLSNNADQLLFFDMFVLLMRLSYMRKIKDLKKWSEQLASMGREKQKRFLEYAQKMIRENFIYNFRIAELNYETEEEDKFSVNFARFINEKNVIPIMDELSLAQRDIEHNGNAKFIFFDFALKMIVLLIQ